jgi:chromate transporter
MSPPPDAASAEAPVAAPTAREALVVWCRVAALSFGGPAGQIAVMHRILVEEKRWVSEQRFLHALSYCMLLPGPEAQQLAIYLGWLLNGTRLGILAGVLFVLPGFVSILGLSILYVLARDNAWLAAVFYGLKPAVVAVVVHAMLRLGRRGLGGRDRIVLAALAFLAITLVDVPFPAVVAAAALAGWGLARWRRHGEPTAATSAAPAGTLAPADSAAIARRPSARHALATLAGWLAVWWLPVGALVWVVGRDSVLVREAVFFGNAAMVTFGGAYAVLAYVGQRAVGDFGWLTAPEMLDGLAMAETTPGPLIQVVQFVGFLAAWRHPGALSPLVAAVLGSLVTTWVTYAPCFLWILVGAPWIEGLRGRRGLAAALEGITAAVVGVVASLALWFAVHTLFGELREVALPGGRLLLPVASTLDPIALLIALGSGWLLFRTRAGMGITLVVAALVGVVASLLR